MYQFQTCVCPLRELKIQRSCYTDIHEFTAETGKQSPCFGFLCRGTLSIDISGRRLEFPEGSLFYIPAQARYHSVYRGTPEIEFYGLNMLLHPSASFPLQQYALQRIDSFSEKRTGELLERLYTLLASEEQTDRMKAFAEFYAFYAQVLPLLKPAGSMLYPQQLANALRYIEHNFCCQLTVEQIAGASFLSQSRLFTLFRTYLSTTPMRYLNALRLEKALDKLRGSESIGEIAYSCGFRSEEYFRQVFRQQFAMTPLDYRKSCQCTLSLPVSRNKG